MLVQALSIKFWEWEVMTEDVVVHGGVPFEPDDRLEIEVVPRFVEEEVVRLDKERAGEGDTHPPTSRHVLGGLLHHLLRETETVEDRAGLGLECARVHLLEWIVTARCSSSAGPPFLSAPGGRARENSSASGPRKADAA